MWYIRNILRRNRCLGRVVDILEASGAFDPGSNPGRGVLYFEFLKKKKIYFIRLVFQSTGLCFNAATRTLIPDSISCRSSTSTGEWIYLVGGLMVVLGIPPFVR